METLKLTRFHGKVKFAGILFCIAGVTSLAFYQGPMFRSFNHHHLFQNGSASGEAGDTQPKKQWVLGIFLMTLSNVLAGLWTVLQVRTYHFIYPGFRYGQHALQTADRTTCSVHAGGHLHLQADFLLFFFLLKEKSNLILLFKLINQGSLIEDTSKLMNTTLQISWASLQAFLVAVAVERDFSKWKLGWNVGLAAIIYSVRN